MTKNCGISSSGDIKVSQVPRLVTQFFNTTRFFSVIMPPSALEQLTRLNIIYPMLFKLTNKKTNRVTHCGVLEFVADEGKVYLPYWVGTNFICAFYFSLSFSLFLVVENL